MTVLLLGLEDHLTRSALADIDLARDVGLMAEVAREIRPRRVSLGAQVNRRSKFKDKHCIG